jgi:hypothetical protein
MRHLPLTAQQARERLEASALYRRREREASETHSESKLRALWYLDPKFQPRYQEAGR